MKSRNLIPILTLAFVLAGCSYDPVVVGKIESFKADTVAAYAQFHKPTVEQIQLKVEAFGKDQMSRDKILGKQLIEISVVMKRHISERTDQPWPEVLVQEKIRTISKLYDQASAIEEAKK